MLIENSEPPTAVAQEELSAYQEFLAERDEILRHKWIESEKRNYDVGYEEALVDWVSSHREEWKKKQPATLLAK